MTDLSASTMQSDGQVVVYPYVASLSSQNTTHRSHDVSVILELLGREEIDVGKVLVLVTQPFEIIM